ncbi:uncharacterized protein BO72DRAFT_40844 [Aspergillus fijiensis CBS 313.89]|uniref:2EXR domain-containing protein n=1 Tax=Aspergillus fijiensis CBS 313.89 TaxID=1448319 RepID=A0A8G1RUS8_9EURO|nr:uncharacterized protein BO72DRAFT_40844 [Aspergillus fijiensis CBS 313.89]RAK79288.1 hypothetical protein BO72DRAFT_40844 [Aspergillus fijiensis CBS 313.89]
MGFFKFSYLPAELRTQIWEDSLPQKLGRPIYRWKEGCWQLSPCDPTTGAGQPTLEFRHTLLQNVRMDLPQGFVNREARTIALRWLQRQGATITVDPAQQPLTVARVFDPIHDALYISSGASEDYLHFILEPFERLEELEGQSVTTIPPAVRQIALARELFVNSAGLFHDIFRHFQHIQTVYVIEDVPPDLEQPLEDTLQDWWELERTTGVRISWDFTRDRFTRPLSDAADDQRLWALLNRASVGLRRQFPPELQDVFEVYPVVAVRREAQTPRLDQ